MHKQQTWPADHRTVCPLVASFIAPTFLYFLFSTHRANRKCLLFLIFRIPPVARAVSAAIFVREAAWLKWPVWFACVLMG